MYTLCTLIAFEIKKKDQLLFLVHYINRNDVYGIVTLYLTFFKQVYIVFKDT